MSNRDVIYFDRRVFDQVKADLVALGAEEFAAYLDVLAESGLIRIRDP